jgi:hypothetical protein
MMSRATLACVLILGIAAAATAQTPPAPRPSPPPAQEPLEPDRPDVTNGTHIVDTGLLQLEFGGMYTRVAVGQRNLGSPVTARLGLTEWLEARVGADGLLSQVDSNSRATGFGNVQLGAKLRLWADPGGIPVLSILPTVNLPTASVEKGLGSGDADYTVALLTGTDFLKRAHIDVNYGIGAIGAGGGQPHFVQHLVSASASVSAGEQWDPYAEVFWFSRQDVDGGAMTAIDLGAIYTINPRLALDGGAQFGLSRAAPNLAVFGGVSIVLGNVLGQHGVHARQRTAEKRARSKRH